MKDLFRGAGYLLQGFSLLRKPGLRRFVLMPLLINILLFAGLIGWAYGWVDGYSRTLISGLPDWLYWLRYIVVPVFVLTSLVVIFYGFSILANLIAAPFNGLLAEAVEKHLAGTELQGDWRQLLRDIVPSILSELRKLLYFALRAIPLLLLLLIPLVNVAASVLWVLFSAWMMTVQYMDYPMANHHLFFSEQRARLRKRPMLAWSFGGLVMLCTLVPVVNFVVMPAAVAGATAIWVREKGLQQAVQGGPVRERRDP
ncbi:MAG TPA: sulfate transporter CysZ [Gammaproteobacteria bacterium]|nr:sulfate transporter CysZ [Gammaproteobacteria bacterium]